MKNQKDLVKAWAKIELNSSYGLLATPLVCH